MVNGAQGVTGACNLSRSHEQTIGKKRFLELKSRFVDEFSGPEIPPQAARKSRALDLCFSIDETTDA